MGEDRIEDLIGSAVSGEALSRISREVYAKNLLREIGTATGIASATRSALIRLGWTPAGAEDVASSVFERALREGLVASV